MYKDKENVFIYIDPPYLDSYNASCYAPARACGGRYAWFCGAGPGTTRRRLTRVETDSDQAR